jgi:hypothetical protein
MKDFTWFSWIRASQYNSYRKKNPTRCSIVSKFYYCLFLNEAHHQELKNSNSASGFTYFCGCRQLPAAPNVCKTRGWITVFELLMMNGVSLETCWAIKKHWNNKFYYTVASCCLFLHHHVWSSRLPRPVFKLFFLITIAPSFSFHSYQKVKRAKTGNLPVKSCCLSSRTPTPK